MTIPLPSRTNLTVIGDAMMDVTARIDSDIVYASDTPAVISQQPGGSGANTAAWLAASGENVAYIGAVGADVFGDELVRHLTDCGVHAQVMRVPDVVTGTCIVVVDGSSERTMFPDAGANSFLSVEHVRSCLTSDSGHLHVSAYTLMNPLSRPAGQEAIAIARRLGNSVSLDPSSVGPLEIYRDVVLAELDSVDLLLANAAEAAVLTGQDDADLALRILSGRVPTVVIKLGPRGAIATDGHDRVHLPAVPVEAIDSTGAGDAFAAGFLPAWLSGARVDDALQAGLALGARAVSRVGAGPPAP